MNETTKPQNKIAMLDVEPRFVLQVASGIREPEELAEEFGYTAIEWLFLQKYDPFVKAVEAKKEELRASGYTFRMKAAIMAEELLENLYLKAVADDASVHTVLETVKFTSRAAGLDAPIRELAQAGSGFSIIIDLGGGKTVQIGSSGPTMRTIEHDEEEIYSFETFPEYAPISLEKIA